MFPFLLCEPQKMRKRLGGHYPSDVDTTESVDDGQLSLYPPSLYFEQTKTNSFKTEKINVNEASVRIIQRLIHYPRLQFSKGIIWIQSMVLFYNTRGTVTQ